MTPDQQHVPPCFNPHLWYMAFCNWGNMSLFPAEALSINDLRACFYIYIQQLSSFRVPMLWFINQSNKQKPSFIHKTATMLMWSIWLSLTYHIQYTFLSLCQFFHKETDKTQKWLLTVTRRTKKTYWEFNYLQGSWSLTVIHFLSDVHVLDPFRKDSKNCLSWHCSGESLQGGLI